VDDDTLYKRVQQCLDITNWDINAKDNCLGLPLKRAFYFQQAPAGWNGWPCHQVDHLAYNEEVATDLNNLIWKKVAKSTKKCRFKAKALEEALKDRSEVWLGKLRKRGNRLKGTKYHWDHRAELGEDLWFVPFSMADPPKKWSAPKDPSEALKKVLRKLMKAIGL